MENDKIICPKCGNENIKGSSFCVTCGSMLEPVVEPTVVEPAVEPTVVEPAVENNVFTNTDTNTNTYNTQSSVNNKNSLDISDCVNTFVNTLIKPFKTYKEKKEKMTDIKYSGVIAGIGILAVTLINLVNVIINTVKVKTYSWINGNQTKWVWENIKDVNFIKVIGGTILAGVLVIALTAAVYYIASLILKKNKKFTDMLPIAVMGFVPIACGIFLAILLGFINGTVSSFALGIGFIYSLVMVIELVNDLLEIEDKDKKIYVNSACLFALFTILGYIVYRIVLDTIVTKLF